jgi:hypothetical protein
MAKLVQYSCDLCGAMLSPESIKANDWWMLNVVTYDTPVPMLEISKFDCGAGDKVRFACSRLCVIKLVERWLNDQAEEIEATIFDEEVQCGAKLGGRLYCPLPVGHAGPHGRSDDPTLKQNKGNGQV